MVKRIKLLTCTSLTLLPCNIEQPVHSEISPEEKNTINYNNNDINNKGKTLSLNISVCGSLELENQHTTSDNQSLGSVFI